MASLAHYYQSAKSGFGSMNPHDMAQMGEDWLITAATGAGVGLLSAAFGGLDKKIMGFPVPLDGMVSVGLGVVGLQTRNKMFTIASIAAGGSAAVRTFEAFFKKSGIKFKGDFEDLQGGMPGMMGYGHEAAQFGPGVGFGQGQGDRLVEASRFL